MSEEKVTIEIDDEDISVKTIKEKIKEKINKKSKWDIAKGKIIAITPFVCLITFLLIGFLTDVWHPTWLIFLAIPVVPTFLSLFSGKFREKVMGFVSVFLVITYLIIGFCFKIWHPTWVMFFLLPIIGILIGKSDD